MADLFANNIKTDNVVTKNVSTTTLGLAGRTGTSYGSSYVGDLLGSGPPGQIEYRTPGTFTFVVPSETYSVSAVCIGAGGSGGYTWANSAGGGGATAWANNIPVTPGQSITINVGEGAGTGSNGLSTGGTSSLSGFFGAAGGAQAPGTNRAVPISGSVAASGGKGGGTYSTNWQGGGGGAGGYTGDGGDGNYGTSLGPNGGSGSGGGAAGGFGYQSSTYGFGGGGGVDLYGEGTSGIQQASQFNNNWGNTWSYVNSTTPHAGGQGGSGGEFGSPNSNGSQTFYGRTTYHGEGGRCGGGGAGPGSSQSGNGNFCKGAHGGVRIIWGPGRSFPSNAK